MTQTRVDVGPPETVAAVTGRRRRLQGWGVCALLSVSTLTACVAAPSPATPSSPTVAPVSTAPAVLVKWSEPCSELLKLSGRDAQQDALEAVLDRMFITYSDAQVQGFIDNACQPDSFEMLSQAWAHYVDPTLTRDALHTTAPDATAPDGALTATYRNSDGYTFTVQARVPSGIKVTQETASQKPGRVQLQATFDITASATNTTPGRITQYVPFALVPVWGPDSEVCRTLVANNGDLVSFVDRMSGDWEPSGYCAPGYVTLQPPGGEGGVVKISLEPAATTRLGDSYPTTSGTSAFIDLNAAESSLPQLTKELAAPTFWALAGPDSALDIQDGFCRLPMPMGDDWVFERTTTAGQEICAPAP